MLIDIIMPFWGGFNHFREAVTSVQEQRNDQWRLVVIDDAYPDPEPARWLLGLSDPRINYIRNERNLKSSGNFSKSASLMRSEYGVIMGCDDIMHPNYLSRVRELIEANPGVSIIQPGCQVIAKNGQPYRPLADRLKTLLRPKTAGEYHGEYLATSLTRGNWAYFPSICWRVADLQKHKFRLDLDIALDLAMIMDIIFDGGSLVLDNEVCFSYRRHQGSLSAQTGTDGSKFSEELKLFREIEQRAKTQGWDSTEVAASNHFSSRMHAASYLLSVLLRGNRKAVPSLAAHIFAS